MQHQQCQQKSKLSWECSLKRIGASEINNNDRNMCFCGSQERLRLQAYFTPDI